MAKERIVVLVFLLIRCGTIGAQDDATARTAEVLHATGVRAGLCVILGVRDGSLPLALSASGRWTVHGLAYSGAEADLARKQIREKGRYGPVSVEHAGPMTLPYAENLVNLVLAEDYPAALKAGLGAEELLRVLAPDGVACLGGAVDPAPLSKAGFARIRVAKEWTVAAKPRPDELGDWPCFDYGPEGNPVTKDRKVCPATSLRWRVKAWARHTQNAVSGWVSAGGRLFYCLHELAPDGLRYRYVLTARDAYNGSLLWERPLAEPLSAGGRPGERNVVATARNLFLCLEPKGPLVALDASTGETLRTYEGGHPDRVLFIEDRLYLAAAGRSWAVGAGDGKAGWESNEAEIFLWSNGRLYGEGRNNQLVALDANDGKVLWRSEHDSRINRINNPFYYEGTLVFVKYSPDKAKKYGVFLEGYSANDGKRLWAFDPVQICRKAGCSMAEVFGAQGKIWAHVEVDPDPKKNNTGKRPLAWVGLNPRTGDIEIRHDDATGDPAVERMLQLGLHRCNRGRATENYYLFGDYQFYDWKAGTYAQANMVRATCGSSSGMLPANGLVYMPPATCVCSSFMQRGGFHAFAHRPQGLASDRSGVLEKGPAFGTTNETQAANRAGEWPCYRRDWARSGASPEQPDPHAKILWRASVGASLTAPVIAGGKVFLAASEEHRVFGMDAETGKILWTHTASGRVDSPPYLSSEGAALFGCRDGWLYCLRAADGALMWRFRAAPARERILVDGQLESAWPIHGSVVVLEGIVYCAAGWHTALDGGISVYGLRVADGSVVLEKHLEKVPGVFSRANRPVALLTSDGKNLYMGSWRIDPKTGDFAEAGTPKGIVNFGISGFLDHEWAQFSNTKGRLNWSDGRASGKLLASGSDVTCGILAARPRSGYGPEGPQMGMHHYELFRSEGPTGKAWAQKLPMAARALVLAGPFVWVGGRKEPEIPEFAGLTDPRHAMKIAANIPEERFAAHGALLQCYRAEDGARVSELGLDASPVFDGLAVSGDRVFLSTEDGSVICLGSNQK